MTRQQQSNDVVVLGAGPAGSATAITCAKAGLCVALLEREEFPRAAPGETLHPGVLPLLRRLGVENDVLAAGFVRHEGHFVTWNGPRHFVPFGRDSHGPWQGLQAWRPDFDNILLAHARRLGVKIWQPCRAHRVIVENEQVAGIETSSGLVGATYVVDATGRRSWLAH